MEICPQVEFREWIQSNAVEARNFGNYCFNLMKEHVPTVPLQFVHSGSDSNVIQSKFVILEPELKCSTVKYSDIESFGLILFKFS